MSVMSSALQGGQMSQIADSKATVIAAALDDVTSYDLEQPRPAHLGTSFSNQSNTRVHQVTQLHVKDNQDWQQGQ